jgi:hypothetical protein
MKDSAYLIFSKTGLRRMVKGSIGPSYRKTYRRPALKQGEYAVFVTVEVPNAVFAPQPTPEATITVPEAAVVVPRVEVEVNMPPADGGEEQG